MTVGAAKPVDRPVEDGAAAAYSITGARDPHSQELNGRIRRYLISMGIRTVCVVLAVVVPGPLRWVFIVGAIGLPYVAVIMANAVGPRRGTRGGPAPVRKIALTAVPVQVDLRDGAVVDSDGKPVRQSAEWSSRDSAEWPR